MMKLIAHRGASLVRQENSVESLVYAARAGASAVECDIRRMADGVYVIYHDDNLERITGRNIPVKGLTSVEMRDLLAKHHYHLTTIDEIIEQYHERSPILLHLKSPLNAEVLERIRGGGLPVIYGIFSIENVRQLAGYATPSQLLAFMPTYQNGMAEEFARAGVGILRLWEQWLGDITPAELKAKTGAEVWVMSNSETTGQNGSFESLDRFYAMGADGALLNDIDLGMRWKSERGY